MTHIRWPEGARSAAVVAFDLDGPTGAALIDRSIWDRPRKFVEGGYDIERALGRTLDILRRHGVAGTYFVPAWVAERWPRAVRRIVDEGHEVAHHGYEHERFADLDAGEQREVIRRSQSVFRDVFGASAVGYRTPTGDWSRETPGLLEEEGFLYSSSLRNDHEPYRHVIGGRVTDLIEIPARVDLDDYAYFAYSRDPDFPSGGDRIAPYRQVLGNLTREAEGHHRVGGCLISTFHPKVSATPGRARVIDEFVAGLVAREDCWVTTAEQVARHVRAEGGEA